MTPRSSDVVINTRNNNILQAQTASINNRPSDPNHLNAQTTPLLPNQNINDSSQERSKQTQPPASGSEKTRYRIPHFNNGFYKLFPGKHSSFHAPFLPVTHKAPLLLTVSAGCIVLLVLLEVLSCKNARDGGIMFAKNGRSLGPGQDFTYLYLPTIIAVIGSIIWSWIDLDDKRLESFFQLSKPDGASGSESVLLSYPVDFLAFVPITAARRRHYTVVAAGVAMCLIFWVITPLQAAIFGTSQVTRSQTVLSSRSTGIVPKNFGTITSNILGDQLNGAENVTEIYNDRVHTFLDTVYAVTWLNESTPPFTTKTYAVAPFDLIDQDTLTTDSIHTASTILYETDVACEPAKIKLAPSPEYTSGGNAHYNVTNSQGFLLGIGGELEGNGYKAPDPAGSYTGYCNVTGDPTYGISTEDPGPYQSNAYCGSANSSFTFLALWQNDQKTADDETKGLLGAFCKPAYYSQLADVTVFQNNRSIKSTIRKGTRQPLDPAAFNISQLENLIANTDTSNATNIDTSALVSSPSLGYTPAGKVPLVIGIGIGLTSIGHAQMPDPGNLETVVKSAHSLMFAAAAQAQMSRNTETVQTQVTRQEVVQGVVIVRAFAIVIEVLLAIVAAIAISILMLSARRPNRMTSDPHSLAGLMALCSSPESETLLGDISAHELATESELKQPYGDKRFVLSRADSDTSFACISSSTNLQGARAIDKQANSKGSYEAKLPRVVKPARPRALSLAFGGIFISVLVVLIIALSLLKGFNDRYNGFTPPTQNAAVQQIIFGYLPTAIGTFIEPAWVHMNRLFAILMPWEELRRGRARFDASIGANYVSLPPQLLFVRALRSKHLLLSSICAMALLANVLAVAFSGLFKQATVVEHVNVAMRQQYNPNPPME